MQTRKHVLHSLHPLIYFKSNFCGVFIQQSQPHVIAANLLLKQNEHNTYNQGQSGLFAEMNLSSTAIYLNMVHKKTKVYSRKWIVGPSGNWVHELVESERVKWIEGATKRHSVNPSPQHLITNVLWKMAHLGTQWINKKHDSSL